MSEHLQPKVRKWDREQNSWLSRNMDNNFYLTFWQIWANLYGYFHISSSTPTSFVLHAGTPKHSPSPAITWLLPVPNMGAAVEPFIGYSHFIQIMLFCIVSCLLHVTISKYDYLVIHVSICICSYICHLLMFCIMRHYAVPLVGGICKPCLFVFVFLMQPTSTYLEPLYT